MNVLIENLPSILMGIYVFFKAVGKTKPDETPNSKINQLEQEIQELKEEMSFIKGKLSNIK
jgi:hypothetical protein